MKYVVEPKGVTELAFCNACKKTRCCKPVYRHCGGGSAPPPPPPPGCPNSSCR